MPKTKTTTSKASYKREWRRQNYEDKRFNKVINEYLRVKHENIFNECCDFYQTLEAENPKSKDFTRTPTFRRWKKQIDNQNDVDAVKQSPVKLVTYTIKDPEVQAETITFSEVVHEEVELESEPVTCPEAAQETVQGPESFLAAVQELFTPQSNNENINIEFDQADNITAEIIDSLEQDHAIRDLLNVNVEENNQDQNEHDEGIALNYEDEIIEPFDFYLEVF